MKIAKTDFLQLKNSIKFLEYYWAKAYSASTIPKDFQSDVNLYIQKNLYSTLTKVRKPLFGNKYIISEEQFRLLNKYSEISIKLEELVK